MAVFISLLSIAALTAADQIIKYFVLLYLKPIGSVGVINGFLEWNYVENTGAAFGSFSGNTALLSIITAVIIIAGIAAIILKKINNKFLLVTATVIIAGGLGNLIDRIFRGYVVDFIKVLFIDFPVFNFADILVTCGSFMLIIYLIIDIYKDSRKKRKGDKLE
ncbi:MAG: signal peptidase II [Acutalibacteraceae bacterium]